MVFINKAFRDRLQIVEEDQLGPLNRLDNPAGFHPMVRENWQTADKLRGLLGTYRVVYTGSAGAQSWNYAAAIRGLHTDSSFGIPGATDNSGGDTNLGFLVTQLNNPSNNNGTNIVVNYNFSTDATDGSRWIHLAPAGTDINDPLTLAWKNYLPGFHSPSEGKYWLSNNFRDFLTADNVSPYNSQPVPGLLRGLIRKGGAFPVPARWLYDHASNVSVVSADKQIRDAAGYNVNVEPVYNFYPSTTPPYEEVIADPQIPEYCLPNVYYLQSELNNTGSSLRATYHLGALTLSYVNNVQGPVHWFNIQNQTQVTEANVDRYYDMYAEALADLRSAHGNTDVLDNFPGVKDNLEKNNQNFVVLHSDLDAIKEDRIDTAVIPFYNRIVLGNDPENRTGIKRGVSILRELYNNIATRDTINMLQMEAVLALTQQASRTPSSIRFMESHKKVLTSTLPIEAGDINYTSTAKDISVLYDVGDLLTNDTGLGYRIPAAVVNNMPTLQPIQPQAISLSDMPFRLIRDYNLSANQLDCSPAQAISARVALAGDGAASASRVSRNLGQILSGSNAHTETLLYIVKKRDTTDLGAPPLQTFYISPEFGIDTPTVYIDAQVKYGKEYHYEIERVVLVFGNKYRYLRVRSDSQGQGAPFAGPQKVEYECWPSIKALVLPYANGPISSILEDLPPVPPEVNFYPYKGINNKLKILLNSSTGKLNASPVSILATDEAPFLAEYQSQTGDNSIQSYEQLKGEGKKIDFRSDDPVDAYQLFRLDTVPESYRSFAGTEILIDPDRGIPGSFEDTVLPNTKYYYCARSRDIHNNYSNPTHIYEIEIVDNNGQIFVKQRVFNYEAPKDDFVKDGRRFIYIEPSFAQVALASDALDATAPSIALPPPVSILGADGVNKVWTKEFKVRLTSKKTGRKLDLNLTFKNSGIVNASE